MLIEQAKQLIKKGVELQDEELIQMGQDLLDNVHKAVVDGFSPVSSEKPIRGERANHYLADDAAPPLEEVKKDNDSFITQTKPEGSSTKKTFIGEDGEEHTIAKKMEINTKKMKINLFDPEEVSGIDKDDKKMYNKPVPRRQSIKEVDINCERCGKHFSVFPSQLKKDSETKQVTYICNSCIVKAAGRR